jgi:hypothetical protein
MSIDPSSDRSELSKNRVANLAVSTLITLPLSFQVPVATRRRLWIRWRKSSEYASDELNGYSTPSTSLPRQQSFKSPERAAPELLNGTPRLASRNVVLLNCFSATLSHR